MKERILEVQVIITTAPLYKKEKKNAFNNITNFFVFLTLFKKSWEQKTNTNKWLARNKYDRNINRFRCFLFCCKSTSHVFFLLWYYYFFRNKKNWLFLFFYRCLFSFLIICLCVTIFLLMTHFCSKFDSSSHVCF